MNDLIEFLSRHRQQGAVRVDLAMRAHSGGLMRLDIWPITPDEATETLADNVYRRAARDAEINTGSLVYFVRAYLADGALSSAFDLRFEGQQQVIVPASSSAAEKELVATTISTLRAAMELMVKSSREFCDDARQQVKLGMDMTRAQADQIKGLIEESRENNRMLREAGLRREEAETSRLEAEIRKLEVQARINKETVEQSQTVELGDKVMGYFDALVMGTAKMPASLKEAFQELNLTPEQLTHVYAGLNDGQKAKLAVMHKLALAPEEPPAAPPPGDAP